LPIILVYFSTLTFTWEEEEKEEKERKEQDQDSYFHLKRTTWFRITSLHTNFTLNKPSPTGGSLGERRGGGGGGGGGGG
jgi:hypothetical protein